MVTRKKGPKRNARRRRIFKKKGRTNVDVSMMLGGLRVVHGLIGLDNVFALNFQGMGTKLSTSILTPFAPGGLVDDVVEGGKVLAACKLVNGIQKAFTGKNIGFKGYHL